VSAYLFLKNRLSKNVVGKMENVLVLFVRVLCNGCVEVCPVNALKREKLVIFDKDL